MSVRARDTGAGPEAFCCRSSNGSVAHVFRPSPGYSATLRGENPGDVGRHRHGRHRHDDPRVAHDRRRPHSPDSATTVGARAVEIPVLANDLPSAGLVDLTPTYGRWVWRATDINDRGWILGDAYPHGPVLLVGGVAVRLADLLPPAQRGATFVTAQRIDDRGEILAWMRLDDRSAAPVLLQPEPPLAVELNARLESGRR